MTKNLSNFSLALAIVATAGLAYYGFSQFYPQYLKNQAVDGCLNAGTLTYKDSQGAQKTEFKLDSYKACLLDKGYKSVLK